VTYAQLASRVDRLSAELSRFLPTTTSQATPGAGGACGAGAEPIIAILLPRHTPDLYAAQLAALAIGCAYTALDLRFPDGHLIGALEDAAPCVVITDAAGRLRASRLGIPESELLDVSLIRGSTALRTRESAAGGDASVDCDRLAYVIYTSGTTGRPKGVEITHRSIVNLVESDLDRFRLTPFDRVAQCSSPAYDSSIEETWLALAAGATLVPLDDETVRLGPDLIPWLAGERITVFCPPPTLLRATGCDDPERALPELRLLYVGGESLPGDLADRWAAGRWMENGYGPTECTVTVVRGRVVVGQPVTIGRPVRGHSAWIVDGSLEEVDQGNSGELVIAGPGLARGYRGMPELTAEKFPVHPRFGRIYRTGDLVRRTAAGELDYLGRIDSQVKLRGYRVELTAIEAVLAACDGVLAAACCVQREGNLELLVAHIVPDPGTVAARGSATASGSDAKARLPSRAALIAAVRATLPEYMVPARIGFRAVLPTSVGGKLDRKALPILSLAEDGPSDAAGTQSTRELVDCGDSIDAAVLGAFAETLRPGPADPIPSMDADFFLELGGDSLSAVSVICALRRNPETGSLSVRDLYACRTARRVAAHLRGSAVPTSAGSGKGPWESRRGDPTEAMPPHSTRSGPRAAAARASTVPFTLVQGAWVLLGVGIFGAAAAGSVAKLLPQLLEAVAPDRLLMMAPFLAMTAALAWIPISVALTVLVKWAVIGRYVPGRHPVWGSYHLRHWMVVSTARLIPWGALEGSMLMSLVLRALGAKVGRRVVIHRGVELRTGGWDLLSLGNDVTLAQESALRLGEFERGELILDRISVGDGVTIDVRGGVSGPATIGASAIVSPLSWIEPGTTVGAGERWTGVPARSVGPATGPPQLGDSTWRSRARSPAVHALLMVTLGGLRVLVPTAVIAAALLLGARLAPDAGRGVVEWLGGARTPALPATTTLGAVGVALGCLSLPCLLLVLALAARWSGRVRPGVVSAFSVDAVLIWSTTGMVDSAGRWLSGSLFWPWWLRLAGMRIGRDCEISTIIDVLPATVALGDECFLADGIYFCSPWRHRGTLTVSQTALGSRTFIGNHAVIPAGAVYADDLFVGVSTLAEPELMRRGGDWFGMPPMSLPRRQVVAGDRRLTHEPGALRYVNRLFWESLRFTLPTLPIAVSLAWYELLATSALRVPPLWWWCVLVPGATLGAAGVLCGAVVVLKWLLLGRVRPGEHPLWSCWCSRWDFLFVAWGVWARGPLSALEGTLFLNAFLRLTGVRIGRGVVLGRGFTQVVDPDMLEFEDGATVNGHFQAHTFEDRILKIDRLVLRRGATLGEQAVVFYGAEIGDGATVRPHSVVMKRDVIPPAECHVGCPTRKLRGA